MSPFCWHLSCYFSPIFTAFFFKFYVSHMLDFLTRKTEYLSDQFSKAKCTEILHICVKIFPSKISPIFSENISDINISHFSKGFFFPRNICHLIPNLSLIKSGIFPLFSTTKTFSIVAPDFWPEWWKTNLKWRVFLLGPRENIPFLELFLFFSSFFPQKI